jgi:hypothetical protein
MAQSMPTVAGNSVKHGAANFQESAVANDLGSKIAEFSQPNLSSAERGNLHHSEKLVDEIPAGRPEITPPKESPEQAKSFCESAKATESMAAGGTNSDALESKPSFWKSGLESLGKHILDEEVITGDPVRDWDIRQQAGVQDVKTILTAATILAPGLGIGGKVAAGGIKCALAGGAVKVAAGGAKSMVKTAVAKVPGGPTLATPNGAPMVCAMEAAPALGIASTTAEGSAAAATKALLPVLQLSKEIGGDGAALFAKRDGKSAEKPQNTSQLGGTGPSGGTDPSKKPEGGRERKVDTPEMRNEFVREKEKSSEWIRHRVIDDKQTWRNGDKTQYFQKTIEKNEIEVYTKRGKHMGVIKPSDGQLRPELKVDGREINLK